MAAPLPPTGRRLVAALSGLVAAASLLPPGPRAIAATRVPEVAVGPEALEAAPRVDARVAEVTVYSDRARVRRRGRATFKAGAAVIRFPDLPGATFLDTVRLSASGARVLRVEAVPIQRDRLAIDQAKKLLDELDAVDDAFAELDDRAALDEWMATLLTQLAPAAPVPEDKREGRKALVVDVASWGKALDFLNERATAARTRLARLADERRELGERRERLRADVAALNQGGFSSRVVEVTAVLEAAAGGTTDLELEYFVPGARWKPVYDLHFSPARGQLRLETAAMVEQATGEDWVEAALSLSTATPGRGIDLPELLTWTLGERSDFVPRPRPVAPSRVEPPMAAPPPPPSPAAETARGIDAQIVRERLARATSPQAHIDRDGNGIPDVPRRQAVRRWAGAMPSPRATAGPPSAAPAAARAPAMDMEEMAVAEEAAPRPRLLSQSVTTSSARGASVASVPLALFDAAPSRRPPPLTDPYLPAVSAGGLDYVYQAPTPATIASSARQVRIPLTSQSFRTSTFYEAAPALAATAFLRARVRNDGKRPLLRGPAAIFGDGELVGMGEIQTTGPGGDIEFPLGADQDIRLVRQVVPSTKTTGFIMKSEETIYDVQIQVGNYKKQPVAIEVVDQIPLSRKDKVEVKLLSTDPAPQGAPDADGVMRWRVSLAAGGTRTIHLRYQIARPKGWRLYQR